MCDKNCTARNTTWAGEEPITPCRPLIFLISHWKWKKGAVVKWYSLSHCGDMGERGRFRYRRMKREIRRCLQFIERYWISRAFLGLVGRFWACRATSGLPRGASSDGVLRSVKMELRTVGWYSMTWGGEAEMLPRGRRIASNRNPHFSLIPLGIASFFFVVSSARVICG